MTRQHGETKYFLVGEDLFIETLGLNGGLRLTNSLGLAATLNTPVINSGRAFNFGRMFRRPNLPEYRPEAEGLIELGRAMKLDPGQDPGVSQSLPAGYTFLGQFIDHDLSFDATEKMSLGEMAPETVESKRSPGLELDSLYGLQPELLKQSELGRQIYESDGIRLKVGETVDDSSAAPHLALRFPNDLPRGGGPSGRASEATIVDPRNDENLAVAQTHLAFIKFHNAVVKHLSGTVSDNKLFEEAHQRVVRHYQWIILYDYLPRLIEKEVLDDVIENGCKHFILQEDENPFMPVEFSVAAFRLGHSTIREGYEWNRFFQSKPYQARRASLEQLFTFTGAGQRNFLGFCVLPGSWVIDWTRFYDFTDFPGIKNNQLSNQARRITTSLIAPLMELPPHDGEEQYMGSLAVRNLLRGRFLGLPAGQCIAKRLQVEPLASEKIAAGPHRQIIEKFGFQKLTPLWYYILKEAELFHGGDGLGPVGSRIIAETFVQLIKSSRVSILPQTHGKPIWEPDLGIKPKKFSMPDLLFFVHRTFENENFLNPLGDGAD